MTPAYSSNPSVFPMHGLNVIRTNNLLVPNNQLTALPWERVTTDTASFWNPANPTVIRIPFTGFYIFGIEGTFAAVAGNRTQQVIVNHNGTHSVINMKYSALAGLAASVAGSSMHLLRNGDTLEAFVLQDSGGDLNFIADVPDIPHFWITLVGY